MATCSLSITSSVKATLNLHHFYAETVNKSLQTIISSIMIFRQPLTLLISVNLPISFLDQFWTNFLTIQFRPKRTGSPYLLGFRPFKTSADGGIRTLVPRRANAFRVRPVMTTSIRLQMLIGRTALAVGPCLHVEGLSPKANSKWASLLSFPNLNYKQILPLRQPN